MAKKDVLQETTDKVTASVTAQAELASKVFALYQAQSEKALNFWMDTANKAIVDGQKAMREWTDLATVMASDAQKTYEATIKEASKAFTPAA